jgi:hypothetical protein
MSTKIVSDPKELKKLRVYLPLKQLNKINALPMDGSLSIKLENLLNIAFAAIEVERESEN